MVSTMPRAVIGLTNDEAPSEAGVPSGSGRQAAAGTDRYCAYIAPPATATVLPSRACASADDPAATTVPAPSLPTGIGVPTRPARPRIAVSGIGAVSTGRCADPVTAAALKSAPANSRPRSD